MTSELCGKWMIAFSKFVGREFTVEGDLVRAYHMSWRQGNREWGAVAPHDLHLRESLQPLVSQNQTYAVVEKRCSGFMRSH